MSLPDIRRIITGDGADGKSRIVEDAPAKAIRTSPERPGFRAVNIWRTEETPAQISAADSLANQKGILPPKNGTILRIIDFPPEPKDPEELKRRLHATFGGMWSDAKHDAGARHPGMHTTETVDYAIVLEGEILGGDGRRRDADARGRRADPARHEPLMGKPLRQDCPHRLHAHRRAALSRGRRAARAASALRSASAQNA